MGQKKLIKKLGELLSSESDNDARRIAALEVLLAKMARKRKKLQARLAHATGKERKKLETRLKVNYRHTRKGKAALAALKDGKG